MSEPNFLYGAAVQGIQDFIFQTNKLREIVGASELVEEICTSKFKDILNQVGLEYVDDNCILHAAGNIKYIFDTKEECERVVKVFPKAIFEFAPGITVRQAVVLFDDIEWNEDLQQYVEKDVVGEKRKVFQSFKNAVNELEKRLRTQRNRPMRSATLGLMGIERSRQTGLPVTFVKTENQFGKPVDLHIDNGTKAKLYQDPSGMRLKTTKKLCEKAFNMSFDDLEERIAFNIEDITKNNDWVAVIHADGNGLGQIVQKIGDNANKFKSFSENLDVATTKAAVEAFKSVAKKYEWDKIIPIRPIVLGGDDLTVVCRADLALDYTKTFIDQFEKQTKELLKEQLKEAFGDAAKDGLTACAGIAYIKSSFPFYYGYELVEALCTQAKKDAKDKQEVKEGKELPMSCLMFHKVQDSFTEDWNAIAERELTPQPNISFQYGPYYLNPKPDRMTIDNLKKYAKKLEGKEGNAVKSHLRQWMSMLHNNPQMANQKLLRLISMTDEKKEKNIKKYELHQYIDCNSNDPEANGFKTFLYNKDGNFKTPVYDILTIHTINNQMTKIKETKP